MSFFCKIFVLYFILRNTETTFFDYDSNDYDLSCLYLWNGFKCKYGNHCIPNSERCDGKVDCIDKSDEKNCDRGPEYIEDSDPLTCKLPRHPVNGRFVSSRISAYDHAAYRLSSIVIYYPGRIVRDRTAISLACEKGYAPKSYSAEHRVCINGMWILGPIDGDLCIKKCPNLDDPSYIASCQLNGRHIDCSNAVEGATAKTTCSPYFGPDDYRPRMVCKNGLWTPHVGPCHPECGKQRVNVTSVIIGGLNASHGEYPWVIAIYNKADNHICGGSIISRKYVLSAAHCFTETMGGKPHDKNDYTIAAGKHYRLLQDKRDENYKQTRKIKELFIHHDYRGSEYNFKHDIALLEVSTPFQLLKHVQLVCIDWDNIYECDSFIDENGVVAGWGSITSNYSPSEVLKKLIVPYRTKSVCKEYLNSDFYNRYFTDDKICGGNITKGLGYNVHNGDSGNGYIFKSNRAFYIRGIANSVQQTSTSICDENNFALYTKVSTYLSWIKNITGKYM